jgi:hypothetical protein
MWIRIRMDPNLFQLLDSNQESVFRIQISIQVLNLLNTSEEVNEMKMLKKCSFLHLLFHFFLIKRALNLLQSIILNYIQIVKYQR